MAIIGSWQNGTGPIEFKTTDRYGAGNFFLGEAVVPFTNRNEQRAELQRLTVWVLLGPGESLVHGGATFTELVQDAKDKGIGRTQFMHWSLISADASGFRAFELTLQAPVTLVGESELKVFVGIRCPEGHGPTFKVEAMAEGTLIPKQ